MLEMLGGVFLLSLCTAIRPYPGIATSAGAGGYKRGLSFLLAAPPPFLCLRVLLLSPFNLDSVLDHN
jgi:hypothetical protein